MPPFNPYEHFILNPRCPACPYYIRHECTAEWPEQCTAVSEAALAYLTDYIPERELDRLLRHSAGDDLLAATLADAAGLDLADGYRLLDAFLLWAGAVRSR